MSELNIEYLKRSFCRELSIMDKKDFAKTYAFVFMMFLSEKRYPLYYRTIILGTHGYPFVSKQKAKLNIINTLLVNIPQKNISSTLIRGLSQVIGYKDILETINYIKTDTNHTISNYFMRSLVDFMEEVDEYTGKK